MALAVCGRSRQQNDKPKRGTKKKTQPGFDEASRKNYGVLTSEQGSVPCRQGVREWWSMAFVPLIPRYTASKLITWGSSALLLFFFFFFRIGIPSRFIRRKGWKCGRAVSRALGDEKAQFFGRDSSDVMFLENEDLPLFAWLHYSNKYSIQTNKKSTCDEGNFL